MRSHQPPSVLLVDDHVVVREGLRMLLELEGRFRVVGEAADVAGARVQLGELDPDLMLLDVSMPGEPVLQAIPSLREQAPETEIVVLTMHDDAALATAALRAGARAFVVKTASEDELLAALDSALEHRAYLQPELGSQVVVAPPAQRNGTRLTPRETEVLKLIALGHTGREIATRLHVSTRTVETHRRRIQGKLGCRTRADLVSHAIEEGLLRPWA